MCGRKRKKTSCPFASSKKPKTRKSGIEEFNVERARSLALSDRGSYYNQDEWLFEQPATSASRMKIYIAEEPAADISESILSLGFSTVCGWTSFVCGSTCEVCLLASFLVLPRDFLFLESRGMVVINVCRTKRFKVEQHNNNSADEIFRCVKEITAVYIQTFLSSGILSFQQTITLQLVFVSKL